MFRNSICDPKDCDHAWALRVLQNSAGTVKTLKNLPRWLVPCPGSLRSVNLQQLSLSGGVSSLPDEALARLQAQAKMRCFVQILPRANKLLFSMPGLSFYRRLPFNTRNIRFLPRFFSALDVSDIEYDAGRLVLEELEVPAVNDLQAPNMSVKKFSAKLRADSGGNGSKLAGLVNVLPRYFPSLEVLELNVRAEEKLDEYLFHDVGVDELSRFVTRVDWMTVLLESTLRNCVPSCKIEVTYSLRLDCVYDSDPETPEYPENATAMARCSLYKKHKLSCAQILMETSTQICVTCVFSTPNFLVWINFQDLPLIRQPSTSTRQTTKLTVHLLRKPSASLRKHKFLTFLS